MLDPVPPTPVEVQIAFNYSQLDSETRIICQQTAKEIKDLAYRDAVIRLQIGQRLLEVKARLGYGLFEAWVEHEFNWSPRTARRFMAIAREFNLDDLAGQSISSHALTILAGASDEAQQEALAAAQAGIPVDGETAKNIREAHSKPEPKPDPFPVGSEVWIVDGDRAGQKGTVQRYENGIPYVEVCGSIEPMLNHWLSDKPPAPPEMPRITRYEDHFPRVKPEAISPLEALSNELSSIRARCDLLEEWIELVLDNYTEGLPSGVVGKGRKLLA